MPNPHRDEVEISFPSIKRTYEVRPHFDMIAKIEATHGPMRMIMDRMGIANITVQEIASIIQIASKGIAAAPKLREIPELVFENGYINYFEPIGMLLKSAYPDDEIAEDADEDEEGNASAGKGRKRTQ